MKKLAYLVVIIFNAFLSNAQWNSQSPPKYNTTLNTIYFLKSYADGLTLKMTDEGDTFINNPDKHRHLWANGIYFAQTTDLSTLQAKIEKLIKL